MKNILSVSLSVVFIVFTFAGPSFGNSDCCPGSCCPPAPVEAYSEKNPTKYSVPAATIEMKSPMMAPQPKVKESDVQADKSTNTGLSNEDRQIKPESIGKEMPTRK